jgi:hypothetical protein
MDTSILTDSSDYSEDFESGSEDLREFSEQDIFPRLFDFLEKSLSTSKYINYKPIQTPKDLAVGLFLSQAKQSKQDILDKLSWEYSLKKQAVFKPIQSQSMSSAFPKILKSISCEARSESEYMNIKSKRNFRKVLEEIRHRVMGNIGLINKDRKQAGTMLDNENGAISKKSEELQDQFYWLRFCEVLKCITPSKILFGVPNERQKNDIKQILDSNIKQSISIKNVISLEDIDYQLALGPRKPFQISSDRKIEVSDLYSNFRQVKEIFSKFLNFSLNQAAKNFALNPCPLPMLLNRTCNV